MVGSGKTQAVCRCDIFVVRDGERTYAVCCGAGDDSEGGIRIVKSNIVFIRFIDNIAFAQ